MPGAERPTSFRRGFAAPLHSMRRGSVSDSSRLRASLDLAGQTPIEPLVEATSLSLRGGGSCAQKLRQILGEDVGNNPAPPLETAETRETRISTDDACHVSRAADRAHRNVPEARNRVHAEEAMQILM